MKKLTLKGIGLIFFGLGLYALFIIIVTFVNTNIQMEGLWVLRAFILIIFPLVALLTIGVNIYGIIRMLKGRKGYGPVHSQKAYLGAMFFVMFSISFVSFIILQIIYSMYGTPRLGVIYTLIFTPFLLMSVLFLALCFVFFIIELIPGELKTFLYIAGVIWVAAPVIHHLVGVLQPEPMTEMFFISPFSPSIIIGVVMMMFCYWKTYISLKQLVPQPPPMPPIPVAQPVIKTKTG